MRLPISFALTVLLSLHLSTATAAVVQQTAPNPPASTPKFTQVRSAHDTCETALALEAADHFSGVDKQYAWLRANYPKHQMAQQNIVDCNGKPTDAMVMVNPADNTYVFILFDLSGYFGKGMGL